MNGWDSMRLAQMFRTRGIRAESLTEFVVAMVDQMQSLEVELDVQ